MKSPLNLCRNKLSVVSPSQKPRSTSEGEEEYISPLLRGGSQSLPIFEVDDKAISDVYWISGEGKDPRCFAFAE